MTEKTVVLSFLKLDGAVRQTCVGCTQVLEQRGMVKRLYELLLNERESGHLVVFYEIAFPYTIEGCREVIQSRHVGEPWGD